MGVASLNVSHNAYTWEYRDNIFDNALVGNLYVGGNGENSKFSGNQYENFTAVTGAFPQYNVSNNYTDNHFSHEIGSGAVNNFIDNSNGTYWSQAHGYYTEASAFVLAGANTRATDIYADTVPANLPGIIVSGTYVRVMGWSATGTPSGNSQGVYMTASNGFDTVTGGTYSNITNANAITTSWAYGGATSNLVQGNLSATYYAAGSNGSTSATVILGYGIGCSGQGVALGAYATTSFAGVAVGHGRAWSQQGSVALGYASNDNGAQRFVWSPNTRRGSGQAQIEFGDLVAAPAAASTARLTANGSATATFANSLALPLSVAGAAGYGRVVVVAWDRAEDQGGAVLCGCTLLLVKGTAASSCPPCRDADRHPRPGGIRR